MKIYYFSLNQKEIEQDSLVCSNITIYNVQKTQRLYFQVNIYLEKQNQV